MSIGDIIKSVKDLHDLKQAQNPSKSRQWAAAHWIRGDIAYPARGSMGHASPLSNKKAGLNAKVSNKALKISQKLAMSGGKESAPTKLYRGATTTEGAKYHNLRVGDSIEHIGPTSWTREKHVAEIYARGGPTTIGPATHKTILHLTDTNKLSHHIDVEQARPKEHYEAVKDDPDFQHETLLAGTHKMRVHKIEDIGGIRHIHVHSEGQDVKSFGRKALKARYSSADYLKGRAISFGIRAGQGAAAGAFIHHLVRNHEKKVQGTNNPQMASTGTYAKHGAELATGASLFGQIASDAHLAARVAKPFVKSDTPIQRLVKTEQFDPNKHPRSNNGKFSRAASIVAGATLAAPVFLVGGTVGKKFAPEIVDRVAVKSEKLLPGLIQNHLKSKRLARAKALLRESGKTVYRGTPYYEEAPQIRQYGAIFVSKNKSSANRFGGIFHHFNRDKPQTTGYVNVHKIPQDLKLFHVYAGANHSEKDIDLFRKLKSADHHVTSTYEEAQQEDFDLSDHMRFHERPNDQVKKILKQHGYSGTLGPNGDIALFTTHTKHLYSKGRTSGRLKFSKYDTPIQRLIKSQPLESMKYDDPVGDIRDGLATGAAGYLIARRKGVHRLQAKLLGLGAAGTVLGAKRVWHNHVVDRSLPND